MRLLAFTISFFACLPVSGFSEPKPVETPNVLWFVVDDMSANFSCYGEQLIETPNVDRLAREGLKFTRAYATSPVCSTFRSAMITGMYQTSIGAHHHRSGRGIHRIQLPDGVEPIPVLFQRAGYFTCNGSGIPGLDRRTLPTTAKTEKQLGKTDYNFNWARDMYDSHDWAGRAHDQPFFMQVQLHGGKLRGASESQYQKLDAQTRELFGDITPSSKVTLPPYYPNDSIFLKDWSTYLDSVRITDYHVGLVLQRLAKEGILDDTLIVFFTDHGISHARGKQFLYDEGTHIPLVLRGPGIHAKSVRDDLVEHIDIAALSLAAAGITLPEAMQGDDVLAAEYEPHASVFAARDRCGEAADRIRSVRTNEFLYIKNFYPQRPLLMPSNYKDSKLILRRLRELKSQHKLTDLCNQLLFAPNRPAEELYRYATDPWQTENLADNPAYSSDLMRHRQLLNDWIEDTGDMGPETAEVYQLEVDDQLKTTKGTSATIFRNNSELYKKWVREGK